MAFDFNPIYLLCLSIAISVGLAVEAIYLLGFSAASYRSQVNRRLMLSKDQKDREKVLIELRRERSLTAGGNYRMGIIAFNKLILQSGLTLGIGRIFLTIGVVSLVAFVGTLLFRQDLIEAMLAGLFGATVLPYLVLRILRARRQGKFASQFPDALDMITRSLRAGHPVLIAINLVSRE